MQLTLQTKTTITLRKLLGFILYVFFSGNR